MDDKQLQDEIDRLKSISESYRYIIEDQFKLAKEKRMSDEDALKSAYKFAKGVEDASKRFKKSYDEIAVSIDELKAQYKKQNLTAEDLEESLKTLRQQVNATADQGKKAALLAAKAELEAANARNKATELFRDGIGKFNGAVMAGFAKSFTGAAASALKGGDGLQVAAEFMSSQLDMANSGVQAGAGAMKEFGLATAGAGGKVGETGKRMAGLGTAIGFLSETVTSLAKAGIGFMMSQTEKMITGFQQMSSVGAVYTGGMQSMVGTALDAGMTIDQFSKAVVENKDTLLKTGMGVADASKFMAKAMQSGGTTARNGMFALGMGMEEQADAYATTMARLAGPMGRMTVSSDEVAEITQKYAADLKLVSDLTGKSAKQQQADADARANNFRMQQELAKMEPKVREQFMSALGSMDEASAKAMQDRITHNGQVTDSTMAVLETVSPSLKAMHQEQYELAKSGKFSAEADLEIRKKYAESSQKELASQEALAVAAQHGLGNMDKYAAGVMESNAKMIGTDVEKRKKEIEEQQRLGKATKDDDGKKDNASAASLMAARQNFTVNMQQIAEKNLPQFAKALETTINDISKSVNSLSGFGAFMATITDVIGKVVGVATVATTLYSIIKGGGAAAAIGAIGAGGGGAGAGMAAGASKIGGKLLGAAKGGIGGLVGGFALDYASDALKESGHEKMGAAAGVGSSALSGAGTGALIGSVIPGVGTAIGGALGGAVGAGYGLYKNWGDLAGGSPKSGAAMAGIGSPDLASATTTQASSAAYTLQRELTDALGRQLAVLQAQLDKQDLMLRTMNDQKDITQKLMYNMT